MNGSVGMQNLRVRGQRVRGPPQAWLREMEGQRSTTGLLERDGGSEVDRWVGGERWRVKGQALVLWREMEGQRSTAGLVERDGGSEVNLWVGGERRRVIGEAPVLWREMEGQRSNSGLVAASAASLQMKNLVCVVWSMVSAMNSFYFLWDC